MSHRILYCLIVACAIAVLLAVPAECLAIWPFDCFCGASTAAKPIASTTYAPPYYPGVPAAAAPVCAPACAPTCVPSCSPCVTVVPSCSPCVSSCVPQSCEMPVVTYRPLFPAPVAYQPVVAAYPVTTYRPFLGVYQTRMVPYTTYRPVTPAVVVYPSYSTCYSPCVSSPCAGSACGVPTYTAAPLGCSSCAVSSPSQPVYINNSAAAPSNPPAEKKTFEKTEKPAVSPEATKPAPASELKPIPDAPVKSSSDKAPALIDPNDRTTSVSAARVQLTSQTSARKAAKYADYPDGDWVKPKN